MDEFLCVCQYNKISPKLRNQITPDCWELITHFIDLLASIRMVIYMLVASPYRRAENAKIHEHIGVIISVNWRKRHLIISNMEEITHSEEHAMQRIRVCWRPFHQKSVRVSISLVDEYGSLPKIKSMCETSAIWRKKCVPCNGTQDWSQKSLPANIWNHFTFNWNNLYFPINKTEF